MYGNKTLTLTELLCQDIDRVITRFFGILVPIYQNTFIVKRMDTTYFFTINKKNIFEKEIKKLRPIFGLHKIFTIYYSKNRTQ